MSDINQGINNQPEEVTPEDNNTRQYVCAICSCKAVVMERDGLVCKNCGWGNCKNCN